MNTGYEDTDFTDLARENEREEGGGGRAGKNYNDDGCMDAGVGLATFD